MEHQTLGTAKEAWNLDACSHQHKLTEAVILRHCPSPSQASESSLDSVYEESCSERSSVERVGRGPVVTRTRLALLLIVTVVCLLWLKQWHNSSIATPWYTLTPSSSHTDQLTQRLPHCIVIGVRKCGTRALLEFLNLHPQVRVAPDEIHFFDKEERYGLGLEWYRQQMPGSLPSQLTIEKSPAYFISPAAPGRIHHMNSSIQLLLILRNPVTRILSDYTQVLTKRRSRNQTHPPLEDLVIDPATGHIKLDYKPVQISMYDQHWVHWTDVFPHSQIHIVDGDSLIKDPLPQLLKVQQFLHLQPFLSAQNFYYNETRGFYCMRNSSQQQRCLGSSKGRPHPQIETSVMDKLRDFFRPHNQRFFDLTHTHFNWDT